MAFASSRRDGNDAQEQKNDHHLAHDPRRDHLVGLQAFGVGVVVRPFAHAEEAPEHRLEGVPHERSFAGSSKNVYESEMVRRLSGVSVLTRRTTGISRDSPPATVCLEKQKHSCFWIQRAAFAGAVFITACAVTARPRSLVTR